jgi:hypothetical protein
MPLPAGDQQLWYGTSVDMQKEVGTTDFSIPYQILWLAVIYGARIVGDISYYFLGELSSCTGTSTNTHTMVPLPTILGQQPPWLLTTNHVN